MKAKVRFSILLWQSHRTGQHICEVKNGENELIAIGIAETKHKAYQRASSIAVNHGTTMSPLSEDAIQNLAQRRATRNSPLGLSPSIASA